MGREGFANEMAEAGGYVHTSNECEKFGMTWGCRGDCPVFSRGDCKIPCESRDDILNTDRFDNFTFEELNTMYPDLNLPIND